MNIANKLRLVTFIIVSILCFCSCDNENYCSAIQLRLDNDAAIDLSNFEKVIIIPGSGCTGCISAAESYFIKNSANDKILFILTNFLSEKSMYVRLGGKDNIQRHNVVVDKSNHYYMNEFDEKIYPYVFDVDGRIINNPREL